MERLTAGTFAILLALSAAACGTEGASEVSPEMEAAVLEAGGPAADALVGTLVTRLSGAIQHGGTASAIEFCSTSASELTARVAREQGLDIKRTSLRYRNPANAPDQAETEALKYFETVLAYYRPLTVAVPCLQCHGTPDEIDPAVRAVLDERYPEDLATDYAVGDFRGVVRVSVPEDRATNR
jgi:hypothetical protein